MRASTFSTDPQSKALARHRCGCGKCLVHNLNQLLTVPDPLHFQLIVKEPLTQIPSRTASPNVSNELAVRRIEELHGRCGDATTPTLWEE